jgi:hypothetical protein
MIRVLCCWRMPVNSTHGLYDQFAESWQRVRDVLAGEDAVKAGGVRYVPRLDTQTNDEYGDYLARGFFYNATSRTVAGYLGMIFRREPVVNQPGQSRSFRTGNSDGGGADFAKATTAVASSVPGIAAVFDAFIEDVDLFGTTFGSYARRLASEVVSVGRGGSLVDWNEGGENRAFLNFYRAEDILNWRVARINGRVQPTMVVLREWAPEVGKDEFHEDLREEILVLRLQQQSQAAVGDGAPTQPSWVYSVERWRQKDRDGSRNDRETEWVIMSRTTPTRHGKPLSSIPFVFHGPTHSRADVERSPIEDIVVANLDHFRLNVEFKHGLHFTALPTAWVSGFDKSSELKVGSRAAWVTETTGATAGFLEFKGDGLQTFERAMDRVERLLAVLGSRLLESQKRVSESAEALEIRQGGEASILGDLANSLSSSLTDVMRWVYWWHTVIPDPSDVDEKTVCVKLNTDFETAHLNGHDLAALVSAWQAGAISRDTLLHNLRQGEILPPGRSGEQELELIGRESPQRRQKDTRSETGR